MEANRGPEVSLAPSGVLRGELRGDICFALAAQKALMAGGGAVYMVC